MGWKLRPATRAVARVAVLPLSLAPSLPERRAPPALQASPVLTSCRLLQLPIELQLRVLEELQGKELCLIELVHPELRRLVSDSPYLYMDVHTKEFGRTIAGAKGLTAKAQYT